MPVVEIATFQASDALLADPDLDFAALSILQNAEGFLGAWTGYDVEDKKARYTVVTWETLEAHKNLHASPSFPELARTFRPAWEEPLTIIDVQFDKDHTAAFDAPLTQLLIHKPTEGKTGDNMNALFAKLANGYASAEGIHRPLVHGPVLEAPGSFVSAIGWNNLEAAASAEATTQSAKLLAAAGVESAKVQFKRRARINGDSQHRRALL
ncbi:hypothetical protein NMY22_g13466 [Coprinellus aureogranulatus]|nr:hypothetical protein NMY22_g13466 [Coprinellus aureogranulatus]